MLSPEDLQSRVDGLVRWDGLPGRPLFVKVWGSYSHNCAHDSSDLDMLAVYQLPTHEILGLAPVREDVVWTAANGAPFDLEAHEIGKFCRLLMKGGAAALETLFTDRLFWASPDFATLMSLGSRFLSRRSVRQYMGYADGQIKRFQNGQSLHSKGGKQNEKWGYHFSRLAIDAERIARSEPPLVWKDGEEREGLMRIRRGETSPEVAMRQAAARIDGLRQTEGAWTVQEESDEATLNDWLVSLRMEKR